MWDLTIRIKKNDAVGDKRLQTRIIDCLVKTGIEDATVCTGVNGFGNRGKSTLHLEGVSVNMSLIIEVVDTQEKLEPLLVNPKLIMGDNDL
jgi:PII-like signaling protein